MTERTGDATFKGTPLTVYGPKLKPGDKAPEFELLDNNLGVVRLSDTAGKVRLISVVPSLDTSVCNDQTQRFDAELDKLDTDRIVYYTVSSDLPFAQARWCGDAGVERVQTLSDHRDMSFGNAWGTHIKELRLEQRSVFIVDAEGVIQYAEYVPEVTDHPDYDGAVKAVKEAAGLS
ncbi:MAG: thiol peroxidase [Candidatus Hydrogenedentota bacterium]